MGGNPLRYIDPTGELLYPAIQGVAHLARIAAPHVARFVASKLARTAIVSAPMANIALLPSDDVPIGGVGSCPVPKKPFALGIDDYLDDFARANNATTWKHFDDVENWRPQVLNKILDPNQKVLFNLDGVDVWGGVSRAASGRGRATDWELLQIRQNPQTWVTIDFIQDGTKAGNPFQ